MVGAKGDLSQGLVRLAFFKVSELNTENRRIAVSYQEVRNVLLLHGENFSCRRGAVFGGLSARGREQSMIGKGNLLSKGGAKLNDLIKRAVPTLIVEEKKSRPVV